MSARTSQSTSTPDVARPIIHASGDVAIPDGALVENDVTVGGRLHVGARARLAGSATSLDGAHVGEGTRIDGSLSVVGTLHWGRGASAAGATSVRGPIVTDGRHARAASVVAKRGIHPGSAYPGKEAPS